MNKSKNIVILGTTGSIGRQTLDIVRNNPERLNVVGLVVRKSQEKLERIAQEFNVKNTVVVNNECSETQATKKIIDMVSGPDVDVVVNAMSGAAGLQASFASLRADKTLALANKESLVVGGDLIMPMAKELQAKNNGVPKLLPIDSEHGAIFQCLNGEENNQIYKLWITASGGPFFGKKLEDLKNVTAEQALSHPTWNMGKKITIDSATLMNKGLEVIEAHHLFGVGADKIEVLVQRQSVIHSMVEYLDGSVKAHLGTTDMRIPIQYVLSYPERWDTPVPRMDFREIQKLDFDKPDTDTFKCLDLSFKAMNVGGTLPAIMNAANEIAVDKFLHGECTFLDIADIVEKTMDQAQNKSSELVAQVESLDQLIEIDSWAREFANNL